MRPSVEAVLERITNDALQQDLMAGLIRVSAINTEIRTEIAGGVTEQLLRSENSDPARLCGIQERTKDGVDRCGLVA